MFGGKLTSERYPEREFVSVPARGTYCEPSWPFRPDRAPALTAQQDHDDILDAADVLGKRQSPRACTGRSRFARRTRPRRWRW